MMPLDCWQIDRYERREVFDQDWLARFLSFRPIDFSPFREQIAIYTRRSFENRTRSIRTIRRVTSNFLLLLLVVLISLHRGYGAKCDPIDESVRPIHRVTNVGETEKRHSSGFSVFRSSKPQWPRAEETIKLLQEFNPHVRHDRYSSSVDRVSLHSSLKWRWSMDLIISIWLTSVKFTIESSNTSRNIRRRHQKHRRSSIATELSFPSKFYFSPQSLINEKL